MPSCAIQINNFAVILANMIIRSLWMAGKCVCREVPKKHFTKNLPTREIIDFIDSCFLYQGVESQSVGFCGNGTLASVLKALPANLFKAGIHMGPFHI